MTEPGSLPQSVHAVSPIVEPRRGWKKLILALIAFVLVPAIPQVRAILPVDETFLLFVPAMAACSLIGWWSGGRPFSALLWIALAFVLAGPRVASVDVYANLLRGWTLLIAGAFGLICLLGDRRPFFVKALFALSAGFVLAMAMSLAGSVALSHSAQVVAAEFARRNEESLAYLNNAMTAISAQWPDWLARFPSAATLPADAAEGLSMISSAGLAAFPALLSLESIAALALAWATYHRLSRQRLGAPLSPLRDFRFNDQLVWGLIVGLVILLLPGLTDVRGFGLNLVVFFGALYAVRGLGVLAWFMRPGSLAITLSVGFVMLWAPILNIVAVLGFLTLGITALGLGVGDTWADWRRRARSTLS